MEINVDLVKSHRRSRDSLEIIEKRNNGEVHRKRRRSLSDEYSSTSTYKDYNRQKTDSEKCIGNRQGLNEHTSDLVPSKRRRSNQSKSITAMIHQPTFESTESTMDRFILCQDKTTDHISLNSRTPHSDSVPASSHPYNAQNASRKDINVSTESRAVLKSFSSVSVSSRQSKTLNTDLVPSQGRSRVKRNENETNNRLIKDKERERNSKMEGSVVSDLVPSIRRQKNLQAKASKHSGSREHPQGDKAERLRLDKTMNRLHDKIERTVNSTKKQSSFDKSIDLLCERDSDTKISPTRKTTVSEKVDPREITVSDLETIIPLTVDNCKAVTDKGLSHHRQAKKSSTKAYIRQHSEDTIWSSILSHYE